MTDPRHPPGLPGQHPQHPPQRPMPAAPAPHLPSHGTPQPVRPAHAAPPAPGARPGIAPLPVQSLKSAPTDAELDPIELVEDELEEVSAIDQPMAPPKPKMIKAFGVDAQRREHHWKRTPHLSGQGAIRVKSFHGKYSDQGLEHLDDMINEWLDAHPEAEVKFVTSTVHVFEGKIREPALVLNVWY